MLCVPLCLDAQAPPPGGGEVAKPIAERAASGAPKGDGGAAAEAPSDAAGGAGVQRELPSTLLEFAVAGGWLMIPITLASISWLAFLVERLLVLRRLKVLPPALVSGVRGLLTGPIDGARMEALLSAHPSTCATLVRAAWERIGQPREELERGVNIIAARAIYSLRRNLRVFSIIANIAPLLGLLGTVTGLVQSFREVAISGLGSGAASLAPGIFEALITTVGGLSVAIPSLLTYYWLMARVDHYLHEMDNLVEDLVEAQQNARAAGGPA